MISVQIERSYAREALLSPLRAPRSGCLRAWRERVRRDEIFTHDAPLDQMFLDDSLEDRRIALAVPGTFWVHDSDRSSFADAQAICLRPQDATLVRELQLLQPPLQEVPRRPAAILLAAFRICLIAAEKDVTPRHGHADARRDFFLGLSHYKSQIEDCVG